MTFIDIHPGPSQDPAPGSFRHRFHIPPGLRYFDGNSLGLMPNVVAHAVSNAVSREWADGLIRSWNSAGWRTLSQRAGEKIARLVGAEPGQVIACDSTSVNLYKVLVSAVRLRAGRTRIVTDVDSFPTDLYIIDEVARQFGLSVQQVRAADIPSSLDADVAAIVLTHVDYRTAQAHDMAQYNKAAHAAGALMIWDLSHTAGAVPCALDASGADFAVGCGYKYLNGGPGAPGYLYVAHRHQAACDQPLAGWFGHARPFEFLPDYAPASGVDRFQCGTSPVLALTALHAALDAFDGTSMEALHAQSCALTDAFIDGVDTRLARHGFTLASPRSRQQRGSHVSLRHPEGYGVMQALAQRQLIGDFRMPDFMRFGFAPLYNTFEDVEALIDAIEQVMRDASWSSEEHRVRHAFT
ncbi:kynureninase [Variovorax sp. M-6]|uniref:kynureninase n=1 Tax=Variovorax sp. M-6 TaxID=3233041 RepID=UPI003F989B59